MEGALGAFDFILGLLHMVLRYYSCTTLLSFVGLIGLPRQGYIVFRFIIEYSSFRDFYGPLGNNNRSILIRGILKDDILACVET